MIEGGCYCRAVRFKIDGDVIFRAQCHCRECQYTSGGQVNVVMGMPEAGFAYTSGEPAKFQRTDLENPVTREFCGACGTPLLSRAPGMPGVVLLKVGALDDPSIFKAPEMAIYLVDKQEFHHVPDGVASFDRLPG